MIELVPYNMTIEEKMLSYILDFYGYHGALIDKQFETVDDSEAQKVLAQWLEKEHELCLIHQDHQIVGFLHLWYKGDTVAWIEDLYVERAKRNQGIGSKVIALAEAIVREHVGYNAICMDVVPRNRAALRLNHKLGYDTVSILTTRKDLYGSKRDQIENLFGLNFKI